MENYQRDFIELALQAEVLRFGEFTLKSGRISPYFFNAGLFNTGRALARLGQYYADTIVDSGIQFDTLFGPAYLERAYLKSGIETQPNESPRHRSCPGAD